MKYIFRWVLRLTVVAVVLHTIVRVVRYFYKFPMPEFMANLIDNPARRRIQPPVEIARRHGIEPGMTVLDIGPGNGTYTLAAARRVGAYGRVIAVDIEPRMIERVQRRAQEEGISNIDARVADVYDLPLEDESVDVVYMLSVIGEIPEPQRALQEFHRVLRPQGKLAFSELITDPDYPRAQTLNRLATAAGFQLQQRSGSAISYTLVFVKSDPV